MRNMDEIRSRLSKVGALGNRIAESLRAQTLVRWVGIPFQRFFDTKGGTHKFLTEKAVEILRSDGFAEAHAFLSGWLDTIVRGNYWADTLWMNATHHYNPKTKRGLWIWTGAAEQIRNWWNQSLSQWRKGNLEKSLFMLGACLHIVQDCCQPFHSNGIALGRHQKYEKWADTHKEDYGVSEGGLYGVSLKAEGWAVANAEASCMYLDDVASMEETRMDKATRVLLPRAMQTSAGFLNYFMENVVAPAAIPERKVAAG